MVLLTAIVAAWGVPWLGWAALPLAAAGAALGYAGRGRGRWAPAVILGLAAAGLVASHPAIGIIAWPLFAWRSVEAGQADPDRPAYEAEARWGAAALALALLMGTPAWQALPFAALALAGLHWGAGAWVGRFYGLHPGETRERARRAALVAGAGLAGGLVVAAAGWLLTWLVRPLGLFLGWLGGLLGRLLTWLFSHLHLGESGAPPPPRLPPARPPGHPLLATPAWLEWLGRALGIALALGLLWLLLRFLARRREGPAASLPEGQSEEVEALAPSSGAVRRRRFEGVAAGRVRACFRRWLALAARHGLARRPSETAAEHVGRAGRGLAPAQRLLEAYERVRYRGDADENLAREAEAAWREIREAYRGMR